MRLPEDPPPSRRLISELRKSSPVTGRNRMISDFNSNRNKVLMVSNVAAMGLQFSNRLFIVFSHVPDPRVLIPNTTGHSFVLFRDEDKLFESTGINLVLEM
jgi:hypothetical protein